MFNEWYYSTFSASLSLDYLYNSTLDDNYITNNVLLFYTSLENIVLICNPLANRFINC